MTIPSPFLSSALLAKRILAALSASRPFRYLIPRNWLDNKAQMTTITSLETKPFISSPILPPLSLPWLRQLFFLQSNVYPVLQYPNNTQKLYIFPCTAWLNRAWTSELWYSRRLFWFQAWEGGLYTVQKGVGLICERQLRVLHLCL
jgi:hypothetical protein